MNYLKINWIKFVVYNFFFKKSIIRKKKCFIIPYFKSSIKISKDSKLYVNANFHIGQNNMLTKRNKTIIELKNSAAMNVNGYVSMNRGGIISVNNGHLSLGSGSIGCDSFINCVNSITIGNNFLISRDVIIRDDDGHIIIRQNYQRTKPIVIGNNVWLCERVTILKGSTVGDNVVVGFGTIVKGKVESNNIICMKNELVQHPIDGWKYK